MYKYHQFTRDKYLKFERENKKQNGRWIEDDQIDDKILNYCGESNTITGPQVPSKCWNFDNKGLKEEEMCNKGPNPINLRTLPLSSLIGAIVSRFQNEVPSFL